MKISIPPIATHVATFVIASVATLGAVAGLDVVKVNAPEPTPTVVATPDISKEFKMDSDLLLRGTNEQRLAAKVPTLYYDNTLKTFADTRLAEVRTEFEKTGRCSHDGFNSSTVAKDLKRNIGENLACNIKTSDDAIKAFMDSPTHKEAMLDAQYSQITIATDGRFAVLLFSTEAYAE